MYKRIISILTVLAVAFVFGASAYGDTAIKPGLSLNGSEAALYLEGKSEHVYIIRFVMYYDSSTAGIAKISANDGSMVRYNNQKNKVTVLYFNTDGVSLNGRKNYIYFNFTNGSYGDFYVKKCELVERDDKLSVLECNEKITVSPSQPIESGYKNRIKQNDNYASSSSSPLPRPSIDETMGERMQAIT